MLNRVSPQKTAACPRGQYTRLLCYKDTSFLLLLEHYTLDPKFPYEDIETKKA